MGYEIMAIASTGGGICAAGAGGRYFGPKEEWNC
jgi:hypothetical protein